MCQLTICILPFYCLLLLVFASVENSSFLATLCSRNPSALPGLCRNYLQNCSAVKWEKWKWTGYSLLSASNSSCSGKLLRFTRTKDVSQLSATCRSKVAPTSETQDRCPPTTQQKVTALAQALGDDFGSGSPTSNVDTAWQRPAERRGQLDRQLQYTSILSNSSPTQTSVSLSIPRTCHYADPRDLAIVIDSSGSVSKSEFDKTVATLADFISHMCHKFECNGPETRFAVLTYGSRVRTAFNFRHSGTFHHSKADVISDIKFMTTYMTGFTATGKALEYCRDKIFQTSRGMRSNSKRMILLLTDGHSNRGTPPGPVATELHKEMGVNIYALGIGDGVDVAGLKSITKPKNRNNLLFLALFNNLYEFFKIADTIKDDLLVSKAQCKPARKVYDRKM